MLAFTFNLNVAREDDSCPCLFSRSYLKSITFLASFETLNIPITYELFCNSPKEGMIKGLWKNHSHESMVCTLNHPTARDSVSCVHSAACQQIPERQKQRNSYSWTALLLWELPYFPIAEGDKAAWKSLYLRPEAFPTNQREHFYNLSPRPACPHPDGAKTALCGDCCFSSSWLLVGI